MRQTFTVTSPAADLSLLSVEQLRTAAGLASDDDSRDAELALLGLRVSAEIATACRITSDGIHPPTLRQETITEIFWHQCREPEVLLARRFVSSVTAVTEQEVALVSADYVLNREAALLSRVSSGRPWHWYDGALSVVYVAGFDVVPADLAGAAMDLARLRLSADTVDPLEKSRTVEIPDVETVRVDRWVGATPGSNAGPVPADIMAKLSRYMTIGMG